MLNYTIFSSFRIILAHPVHARCFATLIVFIGGLFITAILITHSLKDVLFYPSGIFVWTLLEYFLHRFLFHLPPSNLFSYLGARHHLAHHRAPENAPITKPLFLTLPVFILAFCIAYLVIPFSPLCFFSSGLLSGYLIYELTHVATHLLSPSQHPMPIVQKHHLSHHKDDTKNFGISQVFWDYIFQTKC